MRFVKWSDKWCHPGATSAAEAEIYPEGLLIAAEYPEDEYYEWEEVEQPDCLESWWV